MTGEKTLSTVRARDIPPPTGGTWGSRTHEKGHPWQPLQRRRLGRALTGKEIFMSFPAAWLALAFLSASPSSSEKGPLLADVSIQTRARPGTAIHEVNAVATVAVSVSSFAAALMDRGGYTRFMPHVK